MGTTKPDIVHRGVWITGALRPAVCRRLDGEPNPSGGRSLRACMQVCSAHAKAPSTRHLEKCSYIAVSWKSTASHPYISVASVRPRNPSLTNTMRIAVTSWILSLLALTVAPSVIAPNRSPCPSPQNGDIQPGAYRFVNLENGQALAAFDNYEDAWLVTKYNVSGRTSYTY